MPKSGTPDRKLMWPTRAVHNMYKDLKVANNANRSSSNTSINTLTNYFLSFPNIAGRQKEKQ